MNVVKFKKKEIERMDMDVEIIPIAIPHNLYNRHIANLIEQLLLIDEKLNPADKSVGQSEPKGAA